MTADAAISARDLVKRFPRRRAAPVVALDGLTLEIPAGTMTALLGPNGSGKSTLLKCITRSIRPDSGELSVLASDASTAVSNAHRALSVVFQTPGLDRLLTVRENLATQCALFGWSGSAARERIAKHAESVGIASRLDDRVGGLSGGLARRADLARALLSDPELLLLDEPTTGLDPEARAAFLDLIETTRRERPGMTVLMSTHLMDEADRCDSVALLANGRLLAHETPEGLRADLGARALHTHSDYTEALESAGLSTHARDDRVVGGGDADALARAAETLARRGVEFELRAPSLEDVYIARTKAGDER